MAINRRTVSLTCGADGHDEEDVTTYPAPTTVARLSRLYAVRYAGDQLSLTVSEVNPADPDDEDAEVTVGEPLLFIFETDDRLYYPRVAEVVDQDGVAIANEYVTPLITTYRVRVEVDGPVNSTATVDLFYETPGDSRF